MFITLGMAYSHESYCPVWILATLQITNSGKYIQHSFGIVMKTYFFAWQHDILDIFSPLDGFAALKSMIFVLSASILLTHRWKITLNSLHWRHNDHYGVSNHQPHGCLLNRLLRRRSKKTSKLRVTGLCVGIHRDRWIPRTKGQFRGKCFHLMTSSSMCGSPMQNWKRGLV